MSSEIISRPVRVRGTSRADLEHKIILVYFTDVLTDEELRKFQNDIYKLEYTYTVPQFIPYTRNLNAKTEPSKVIRSKFKVPDDYIWHPASRRLATMAGWKITKERVSR